ncbi:MAG: alcohol dehydrogenase catalytic domain-containing protein, partial [Clostridia bacterium]|nr:alcohol dehydrogenase catalytic domain-containing protein [Clostridia bacterium]
MDMKSTDIERIVRQVLESMGSTGAKGGSSTASVPATSRVAMLTKAEHFDIQEYPIPELGDDDVLVKVEGCGVCGTDAHEFKRDPFNLIPVALGH